MSNSTSTPSITFVPYTTFIDPTFWSEVNQRKVTEWKLNSDARSIHATFSTCGKQPTGASLCISQNAFSEVLDSENYFTVHTIVGGFLLTNTKKAFVEELNRRDILEQCSKKLWGIIESKRWLDKPDLLNYFYLTAFADIKQFAYYFWNCLPALLYPSDIVELEAAQRADEAEIRAATDFLKKHTNEPPSAFILWRDLENNGSVSAHTLRIIDRDVKSTLESSDVVTLVFLNPSSIWGKPSWTLRNLLAAVAAIRSDWKSIRVLALRHAAAECFTLKIGWTSPPETPTKEMPPKSVGWERNSKTGSLIFRQVELKSMFDPLQIMEQTAELNLQLIRWQQAPSIQLQRFTELRTLIIGSGTLGCNLARSLLGWGVRHFTFVDHANVSYNNPIRQSLFTFEDCQQQGGAFNKALAAAASLKKIFPRVDARGVEMKIPMPGHPYSDIDKPKIYQNCEELDTLIREHDVIFLVMDSRESRWLPTLIASHHNKLAMTVALGFDSYVVMRHGASADSEVSKVNVEENCRVNQTLCSTAVVPSEMLGCYFCSDVTAPGNSTADRTLDQQCTISRAGVSMVASGIAVELVSSVLQHELGRGAPALLADVDENSSILGGTPHQVRGFLSRFHQMTPTVRRFEQCTACGVEVQRRYAEWRHAITVNDKQGAASHFDDFLHTVFQDSAALEQVAGLTELQASVEQLQLNMLEFEGDSDND